MLSACWKSHQQLLRSEGLGEDCLQATWSALASHAKERIAQGRGISISGLCKVLLHKRHDASHSKVAAGSVSVVLSDQLLKRFPQLQLGAGLSHFAAVKDQAKGAENINFVVLSQRTPGLSKGVLQLVLKLLIGTCHGLLAEQQSFVLDLGVGQLRFRSGRVAEFKLAAGTGRTLAEPTATPARQDAGEGGSSSMLNAELLLQHGGRSAGPSKAGSTVSAASKLSRHTALDAAAKAAPCGAVQCSCTQPVSLPVAGAPTDHVQQHSTSSNGCAWSAEGLPAKPGSTPISPDDLFKARRQARAAAIANARVKPATFVLPAGGPHDGQEQRMPQGKGKPQVQAGATSNAQNQVLQAAAAREEEAAAAQAAAEVRLTAQNAQLKTTLDQQAQALLQQRTASKRQLAEALSQQIQEKQNVAAVTEPSAGALLISGPDPARVTSHRVKQQAEYRAALDQQLAAKAQQQQQLKAQDTERALVELAMVQQEMVASAHIRMASKQQAAEAARQQLAQQQQSKQHRARTDL